MKLSRWFRKSSIDDTENRNIKSTPGPLDDFWYYPVNQSNKSGVNVNHETALRYSAVWACVRVLSDSIASLPLHLFKEDGDSRLQQNTNPLYKLFSKIPNSETSSYKFWQTLMIHLTTWGNAFIYVERGIDDSVIGLWNLRPDLITIKRAESGALYYELRTKQGTQVLTSKNCWHVANFSTNGVEGKSVITIAREAIGLGLAAEEFGEKFFSNGSNPSFILTHPGRIDADQEEKLRAYIKDKTAGLGQSFTTMVLQQGMTVERMSLPQKDSQFIETRKFQVEEIARIFKVPPHMIGDLENATYSNIEEQSIEFVIHSIRPWLVLLEQDLYRYFLSENYDDYFFKFNVDGLLRGNLKDRYEAYSTAINYGILTRNEIRALEDRNPLPDGDLQVIQANMTTIDRIKEPPAPLESFGQDNTEQKSLITEYEQRSIYDDRIRIQKNYSPIFKDVYDRVVSRETLALKRAVKKNFNEKSNTDEFKMWLRKFYEEDIAKFIEKILPGILRSYGNEISTLSMKETGKQSDIDNNLKDYIDRYLESHIEGYVNGSLTRIDQIIDETPPELLQDELNKQVDYWQKTKSDKFNNRIRSDFSNSVAVFTFGAVGITKLVWRTTGDSCPYCKSMNGKTVQINYPFVSEGDLEVDGQPSMKITRSKFNPPLHNGCDCIVASA